MQLTNNDPERTRNRKFIKKITAERPDHAGQLAQTEILQGSEEAWVWEEELPVEVDSCRPSELLAAVELQARREESEERGSSPETAY